MNQNSSDVRKTTTMLWLDPASVPRMLTLKWNTALPIEQADDSPPSCKSQYLSSISYLDMRLHSTAEPQA
jgi:hypothetical protein